VESEICLKRKVFTAAHRADLLEEMSRTDGPFSAEEHARLFKTEHVEVFSSRESLLAWYGSQDSVKFPAVDFVADFMARRSLNSVLSLGAGPCVLEYHLLTKLSPGARVIATDFDAFLIEQARRLFPELRSEVFDFFRDDVKSLLKKNDPPVRLAVFFGSSYVMDDAQFVSLFRGLREAGIQDIIDFYPAFLSRNDCLKQLNPLSYLKRFSWIRRLFGKGSLGKFHGYARSRGELRKLYRMAGFSIAEEQRIANYEYVAVCGASPSK
jgi:hypothetical protein